MSSKPDDPASPQGPSDVHEDPATPAEPLESAPAAAPDAATVIPGPRLGDPGGEPAPGSERGQIPTLGAPAAPHLTAEELASSLQLDDIDEATAQRLISAAIRRLNRDPSRPPTGRADPEPMLDVSPPGDGSTLAWEVVRSIPRAGNTLMKMPSRAAGFRVAGEAPPAFRAEVPAGWIYLIDGVPVFVPDPSHE